MDEVGKVFDIIEKGTSKKMKAALMDYGGIMVSGVDCGWTGKEGHGVPEFINTTCWCYEMSYFLVYFEVLPKKCLLGG